MRKKLIIVSPDGIGGIVDSRNPSAGVAPFLAFEIKCPTPQSYKTPVHYTVPDRYILQLLAEMAALKVNMLLYITWSPESTTVHEVHMDHELWNTVQNEVIDIYGKEGTKPTCCRPFSKEIKSKFSTFRVKFTKFLCEVPSKVIKDSGFCQISPDSPFINAWGHNSSQGSSVEDIQVALSDRIVCVKEAFQLCRRKACGRNVPSYVASNILYG